MKLYLDDAWRDFVSLRAFRQAHGLPADFGVSCFAPKHDDGLAHLDAGGQALALVRHDVLAVPTADRAEPLARLEALAQAFEAALRRHNALVGLREPEIGYAVAGLRDALETWIFAHLHPAHAHEPFPQVYAHWVGESARLDQQRHAYPHQGQTWTAQVVSTVYGRAGLRVVDPDGDVHWVADEALACPAEGFMSRLLAELAESLF
ncbi:MAG: hypothetical protein NZ750_09575 [Anaerolineae bacterium]|nr:hypothetical protein [Anaerolineae bacterium]MDW8171870.1 hypothetical protein [Anaerolineae bacterium]